MDGYLASGYPLCYVYTIASSLTGKVFYVGRGSGCRIQSHLYDAKGKRDNVSRVAQTIRSTWQQGGKVIIRKVYNNLPMQKAVMLEKHLILHYGYEQLVNRPHWRKSAKHYPAVKKTPETQ